MMTRIAKALAGIAMLAATACGSDHGTDRTGNPVTGTGGLGSPGGAAANGGGVGMGGGTVGSGGMLGNAGGLGSGGLLGKGGTLGGGGMLTGTGGGMLGSGGLAMGGTMNAGGAMAAGGGNVGGTTNTGGMAGNAGGGGSPVLGPYPAGPYGATMGAVLANLKLQGYVDDAGTGFASDQPWRDSYTLEDVRATGAKYALIHISEFF
jgi:hypothetical protein